MSTIFRMTSKMAAIVKAIKEVLNKFIKKYLILRERKKLNA